MVKHTLKIFQPILQDFQCVFNHFVDGRHRRFKPYSKYCVNVAHVLFYLVKSIKLKVLTSRTSNIISKKFYYPLQCQNYGTAPEIFWPERFGR